MSDPVKYSGIEMDEALEYLKRFLSVERDFLVALFSKPYPVYQEARKVLLSLCVDFWDPLTDRTGDDDHALFARYAEKVLHVVPRTVFPASTHEHPGRGRVYRAIVSETEDTMNDYYSQALFVAEVYNEPRMVASYQKRWNWTNSPKAGSLEGWSHMTGWELTGLQKSLEVRKLHPPGDPRHLEHFNAPDV